VQQTTDATKWNDEQFSSAYLQFHWASLAFQAGFFTGRKLMNKQWDAPLLAVSKATIVTVDAPKPNDGGVVLTV
jgi:hypothetical protein